MGEIYHIDDTQFRLLDELEWYPDFYQRIVIPTHYGDAWMYIVKAELCQEKNDPRQLALITRQLCLFVNVAWS
jgi:gamma-glutamylcyclotransferase (GGCT)/AIG2-like uncharacterized protein YtfP